MDILESWQAFTRTGDPMDYLQYCFGQAAAMKETPQKENGHHAASDNQGTCHS